MKCKRLVWIFGCFPLLCIAAFAFSAPAPDIGTENYHDTDGNGIGLIWENNTDPDHSGVAYYDNPRDSDHSFIRYDAYGAAAGIPGDGADTDIGEPTDHGVSADAGAARPGDLMWVRRYGGFPYGPDYGRAVATDKSGNVFVMGQSFGGGETGYDYAVLKYSPAGVLLWGRRFNGISGYNGYDEPRGMTLDAAGSVIVTGLSHGKRGVGLPDILTVKYNNKGALQWAKRYYLGSNAHEAGNAVACDAAGNVYVAGVGSSTANTYEDAVLVKYSPTGTQLWARSYNGALRDNDAFLAVSADAVGNAYVTGYATVSGLHFQDVVTVKYSPSGAVLWTRLYNGAASVEDWGESITLDHLGDVVVAGSRGEGCEGNVCYSFVTLKYSPVGVLRWARIYNPLPASDDLAHVVRTDADNNVYVAGESAWKSAFYDFATVKYSPAGVQQWVRRYDGPGHGNDRANGLAIDSKGNAVVTGSSYASWDTLTDWATVKYSPTGVALWAKLYNGPSNQDDMAFGVAVGLDDAVYSAGFSTGTTLSAGDEQITTVKYAP